MKSLLYYLNICSLLCVFMFFTNCEKKVVNQKELLTNGASLSHSTLDQVYNEFMWLEFEKLTNRQLLNRMKEDGYKKANPLLMLNDVLTSHGIQISKFNSSMLNQDFAEVKRIMELIKTVNNDPSNISKLLKISWYNYYQGTQDFQAESIAEPELKDIIFISYLLEHTNDEGQLFSILNNYFDIDRFLDVFFEGKTKTGNRKISYVLDIQYEIYAKSKFYTSLSLLSSNQLKDFERTAWLNLLNNNKYPIDDYMSKKSSDSTILGDLIFSDRNTLYTKQILPASTLEKWYLTSLREGSVDACDTLHKLKQLDNKYYMENFNAFDDCDCWQDYTRYMIISSLNLMALQLISYGEKWPLADVASIDCLESLTDHYFRITGEPTSFDYGVVSSYFMVPYIILASENGRHWGFFSQYIASQALLSPFMRSLHGMYSELRTYY